MMTSMRLTTAAASEPGRLGRSAAVLPCVVPGRRSNHLLGPLIHFLFALPEIGWPAPFITRFITD